MRTCQALRVSVPLRCRPFEAAVWPVVWGLLEPVFQAGATLPHDSALPEVDVCSLWLAETRGVMLPVDVAGAHVLFLAQGEEAGP